MGVSLISSPKRFRGCVGHENRYFEHDICTGFYQSHASRLLYDFLWLAATARSCSGLLGTFFSKLHIISPKTFFLWSERENVLMGFVTCLGGWSIIWSWVWRMLVKVNSVTFVVIQNFALNARINWFSCFTFSMYSNLSSIFIRHMIKCEILGCTVCMVTKFGPIWLLKERMWSGLVCYCLL